MNGDESARTLVGDGGLDERAFRSVVEALPMGVVVVDETGAVSFANDRTEATFGALDVGQPMTAVDCTVVAENGTLLPDARPPWVVARETGEPVERTVVVESHGDGRRRVDVRATAVATESGSAPRVAVTVASDSTTPVQAPATTAKDAHVDHSQDRGVGASADATAGTETDSDANTAAEVEADSDANTAAEVEAESDANTAAETESDAAGYEVAFDATATGIRSGDDGVLASEFAAGAMRGLVHAVLDARTVQEVKSKACRQLASTGGYSRVWFGETGVDVESVDATAWHVESVGECDRDPSLDVGSGVATAAIRCGTPKVQSPNDAWQVAVPVQYRGTTYGVLVCETDRENGIPDEEVTMLAGLGELLGYALNAMERYDAFLSESSIEVEFRVTDVDDPLLGFLQEHDARLEVDDFVEREGEGERAFVAFVGVDEATVTSFLTGQPPVESFQVVHESADGVVLDVTLNPGALVATLVRRGAVLTAFDATGESGVLRFRLPKSLAIRDLGRELATRYESIELVTRRECEAPVRTRAGFVQEYFDQLTDRQRHVLRTAYYGGFFEEPRGNSANELADRLGITQPTVSRHLRRCQRKLFEIVFDGPDSR